MVLQGTVCVHLFLRELFLEPAAGLADLEAHGYAYSLQTASATGNLVVSATTPPPMNPATINITMFGYQVGSLLGGWPVLPRRHLQQFLAS